MRWRRWWGRRRRWLEHSRSAVCVRGGFRGVRVALVERRSRGRWGVRPNGTRGRRWRLLGSDGRRNHMRRIGTRRPWGKRRSGCRRRGWAFGRDRVARCIHDGARHRRQQRSGRTFASQRVDVRFAGNGRPSTGPLHPGNEGKGRRVAARPSDSLIAFKTRSRTLTAPSTTRRPRRLRDESDSCASSCNSASARR
jgi:hypothetical protein